MPKTTAKLLATASVVALCAGSLWGPARGQRARPRRPAVAAGASRRDLRAPGPAVVKGTTGLPFHPAALADDQPPPPAWSVGVDWSLQLDPDTKALYQQMADLLSGVTAVPNDRLNYYSAVNQPPEWAIGRWTGLVTDVQPAAGGGYTVTATADPFFPNNTQMTILSDYSETYFIDADNAITYQGFSDPNHWAGTIPGLSVK